MNEQKILRKQLFKYIRSNLLIFVIVFSIFGLFMYELVSRITYDSLTIELRENVSIIKQVLKKMDEEVFVHRYNQANSVIEEFKEYSILSNINNPKILCIIRDGDGDIVNSNISSVFENYNLELDFDKDLIDKVYEVVIDDEYYYRGITVDLSDVTDSYSGYIQLLANVDTEKEMVQIYHKIIIWSVSFGILISVIASIVMSNKNLRPVAEMLKKQNDFVQNVSHELRTPLTIIQAKQELLLSEPNAKIIDKTEEISLTLNEAKRMSKLTKDLMLLSRADNKQMVLQKEEVEIDEFISNIGKTYSEIISIQEKELKLNLNCKKMISIDTNKIYQVMVILIDNAMKYTEKGDTIEINTFLKDNKCVIEVKDTGIGMSDEAMKHVFERFYREDTARSRETGGTGLGLSIADMIVSSHSGTIKATHNGNKGSIFTVRLPR